MNYNMNKSLVECYKFRQPNSSEWWADITINCSNNSGTITIASDYGNWQQSWNATGMSFKEFLIKLSMDYTAGKFGCNKALDMPLTIKTFSEYLEDYKSDFDKDGYKSVLKEIDSLHRVHPAEFINFIKSECPGIMKLYEQMPDIQTDVDPLFQKFWMNVWPHFVQTLKLEIELDQAQESKHDLTSKEKLIEIAKKYERLEKEVEACYIHPDGTVITQEECEEKGIDLVKIGEIAAIHFGYL